MESTAELRARLNAWWRRIVWGSSESRDKSALDIWVTPLRVLMLTVQQFKLNQLRTHASGLSFYLMLSLVPVLAFVFLVAKLYKVPEKLKESLLEWVTGGNMAIVDKISEYIDNTQSSALGGVGVLTLLAIGFLLLQRVKHSLNLIWQVEKWPGLGPRLIEYVTMMTVTPVLLLASFGVSTFLASIDLQQKTADWVIPLSSRASLNLAGASGYLLFLVIILYAYWILPDSKVRLWAALIGALVGSAVLWSAENFYIKVMLQVTDYNPIYGTLAFLPLLAIWFYLAWLIFLFGAQLSRVLQHYNLYLDQRRAGRRSRPTMPYIALLTMTTLLRRYRDTGKPVRLRDVRRDTGLPSGVVDDAMARLATARLIMALPDEPGSFIPREIHESTTAMEVLQRLEVMPGFAEPVLRRSPEGKLLVKAFHEANLAIARPLRKLTLDSLVEKSMEDEQGQKNASRAAD
ncbi:MAG: YihY/virulence factor BrkB family protein [SAR324 cluster bacterium]|nr:YihY/virulence factor BrkB family protein [SAR324 cluster bacterium]